MREGLAEITPEFKQQARLQQQPRWIPPMIARLSHEPFSDPNWIFERKLDGVRLLAFRSGDSIELIGRNKKRQNEMWPEVESALLRQDSRDFILDGELVAFQEGRTGYSCLHGRFGIRNREEALLSNIKVYYYVFDILHLDGHNLRDLPLIERKRLLRGAIQFDDPVCFCDHRVEDGVRFFEEAQENGFEGIIGKRADSTYNTLNGADWIKFKCSMRQEFVIGGYTRPRGRRVGLGSMLVGYHDEGRLMFAGGVGTGLTSARLEELRDCLEGHTRETSPFADLSERPGAVWVDPVCVCECAFTEWTKAGRLRHPRFLGLREDKEPFEVTREVALTADEEALVHGAG